MGGKKKYIEMFGSFAEPFSWSCSISNAWTCRVDRCHVHRDRKQWRKVTVDVNVSRTWYNVSVRRWCWLVAGTTMVLALHSVRVLVTRNCRQVPRPTAAPCRWNIASRVHSRFGRQLQS